MATARDLGAPIAWLALKDGMPVYDRGGETVGVVEHVVGYPQGDIFDGVIVHTRPLPGRHLYADIDQIAELREQGVVLAVGRDELHEPPRPGARRADDDDTGGLEARLRRAWDWLAEHLASR
jgi:hypothetical protein